MVRNFRFVLICLVVLAGAGQAATRRALLVGINRYPLPIQRPKYQPSPGTLARLKAIKGTPSRELLPDLDGAFNDALSLKRMLIEKFGFEERNILLLPSDTEEATADNILSRLRTFLIEQAKDGDESLFYFAGHGSRIRNTAPSDPKTNPNASGYDTTIVPADSLLGVPDVRSKEMGRIFAMAPARGVKLTVILDSCYGGAGSRGPLGAAKVRSSPPDEHVAVDERIDYALPEKSGVLFLAASQENQVAQEVTTEMGAHGAFTWALLKTLGSSAPDESTGHLMQRTRALMQSKVPAQEPVMLGTGERLHSGLFGQPAKAFRAATAAVRKMDKATGAITLNAGQAMSLYPGTELKRILPEGAPPVEIRIKSVEGLAASTAVVTEGGSGSTINPGDLFQLDRWVAPPHDVLRVSVGPTLPAARVAAAAQAFAALRKRPGIEWVEDPTEVQPTHVVSWDGTQSKWTLSGGSKPVTLDGESADAVVRALGSAAKPRLYVMLPAAAEVASRLDVGQKSTHPAIGLANSPEEAHYALAGRVNANGKIEYAWMLPLQTSAAALNPKPVRTDWYAAGSAAEMEDAAGRLTESAQRLARVVGWLELETPGHATDFPYELVLQNQSNRQLVSSSAELPDGEKYDLVLRPKPDANWSSGKWRVYVFILDSYGKGQLLFGDGNLENEFPRPNASRSGPVPTGAVIQVADPYGTDTYVLVALNSAGGRLFDAPSSLFTFEGVQTAPAGVSRGGLDPLALMFSLTGTGSRGAVVPTPASWTLQRAYFRSLPPAKKN